MKFGIYASLLASLFVGCNEFQRSYENIDGEFARAISFYFDNPEMAPGDTVTLRSFFAGKPINPANVKWGVSWEFLQDIYDESVTFDSLSLDQWIVEPMRRVGSSSDSIQEFQMKFVIPDSIMRKSPGIPENWIAELKRYGVNVDLSAQEISIPQDKQGLLDALDSLATLTPFQKANIPYSFGVKIDGLCQYISAGFKIYCDYSVDGGFSGELFHTVRYHSRLDGIPGVFTNSRPEQIGATLHVVEGAVSVFKPGETPVVSSTTVINNAFTITYLANQSYFLEVRLDERDSVLSPETIFKGKAGTGFEEYTSYWMYDANAFKTMGLRQQEDNDDEIKGQTRMIFKMNFGAPSAIVRDKPLKYYLESGDRKFNTVFRPKGKDLKMYTITVL